MDALLAWIEEGPLSLFLRESDYGFSGPLAAHIIGVALVAGPSIAVNFALLGLLPGVPIRALKRFLPFSWLGLLVSVPSGTLLVAAYPTKSLTNPLFYFKLVAVLGAVWVLVATQRLLRAESAPLAPSPFTKGLAATSLALWAFVIAAGRLLAYTYTRLLVGF